MRITTNIEETKTIRTNKIVGLKCDICGKQILPVRTTGFGDQYNYFVFKTAHHDYGIESVEDTNGGDACSIECMSKYFNYYISKAFKGEFNTREITVEHGRALSDSSGYEFYDYEWEAFLKKEGSKNE